MCYNYKCDECGLEVILDYEKDCYLQFSIDRLDDSKCHTYDNIRLTCLSCNVNHQKNTQVSFSTIYTNNNLYKTNCKNCISHYQNYN